MNINHRIVESLWTVWNTRYINSWQYTTKRQRYRPWKGWTQPRRCCPRFNSRPQKGATLVRRKRLTITRFQSTPPKGSDFLFISLLTCSARFNPRPQKGATTIETYNRYMMLFQSTPPKGSDGMFFDEVALMPVSIHAPKRERRIRSGKYRRRYGVSIHAPKRERRVWVFQQLVCYRVSIHAPKRERPHMPYSV